MMSQPGELVCVCSVQGRMVAQVVKSRLEEEGIPVLLQYESAGPVIGLTVDGLGEVKVMVPEEYAEAAREAIGPVPP